VDLASFLPPVCSLRIESNPLANVRQSSFKIPLGRKR